MKPFMCFKVVRGVSQNDLPVAPNGDAIVRIRKVFRCEPKVERVLGHQLQSEIRGDRWRARFQCDCVQLPDERDVPHRVLEVFRAEVKVIHSQGLLKNCRIRTLGNGHHH